MFTDVTYSSLLSYFVVFSKNGFTPGDLVKAQKQGGLFNLSPVIFDANISFFKDYFTKKSPPFMNSRGQTIDATKQVDALAQAQSIVYLSIFICQAFNVCFFVKSLPISELTKLTLGVCCKSTSIFPLRQECCGE